MRRKMRRLQKKVISAILVCVMLIAGAAVISINLAGEAGQGTAENTLPQTTENVLQQDAGNAARSGSISEEDYEAYQAADLDLMLWYEDETYTVFLEQAAVEYFKQTGIKVCVERQETIDYIADIYDRTMQDNGFPDIFVSSGDNLEEIYLYGLAAVNERGTDGTGMLAPAAEAATYGEKLLGYPLSYNTCLFVYQNGYFDTAPESIQAIIEYSDENEPPENVSYLLEWNVNDAFYDFPFISNSVSFDKSQAESMNVRYDEELYQKDLEFFEAILESFSVDASTASEENIADHFLTGKTLCAILDTDSLYRLKGYDYSAILFPKLNDELSANSCSITDILVVNDFSENGVQAADFAEFVTVEMAENLHELSGHYSVIPSEYPDAVEAVACQAYERATPVPDSSDAKDFWVKLEETISKYF